MERKYIGRSFVTAISVLRPNPPRQAGLDARHEAESAAPHFAMRDFVVHDKDLHIFCGLGNASIRGKGSDTAEGGIIF